MRVKVVSPEQRVAKVRIFWDEQAFRVEGGHPKYLDVKACHDELFQSAIDLRLATGVLVMQREKKPLKGLAAISSVFQERPKWWPANQTAKGRGDLLFVPLPSVHGQWAELRRRAELTGSDGADLNKPRTTLWHDDPALVHKQRDSKLLLCRTACVGHEGHVFYFVYPEEQAWQARVASHGFELWGEGRQAYESLVKGPLCVK